MAVGNGVVLLQVSPYSLAGVDTTTRRTIVEGQAVIANYQNSLATLTVVAGGTGWVTGDQFLVNGGSGGVGTVTASAGVVSAVTLNNGGFGYKAGTAQATTPVSPSVGRGLTVTTTVATGGNPIRITSWAIVSNVLTLQAVNSLTGGGGQSINISGYTGSLYYLNGTYTTTSATGTTIVVPKTAPNASGTQDAMVTLQPTYTTGGLPINYSFIDLYGNPNPIGTIGPLAVPEWIEFATSAGTAFNYVVNLTGPYPLLKVLNGITELSNAAAMTIDVIKFRAEFSKGAF